MIWKIIRKPDDKPSKHIASKKCRNRVKRLPGRSSAHVGMVDILGSVKIVRDCDFLVASVK
jgi:hypothetical protein